MDKALVKKYTHDDGRVRFFLWFNKNFMIEIADVGYHQHQSAVDRAGLMMYYHSLDESDMSLFGKWFIPCIFKFQDHPLGKQILEKISNQDFTF